ncbi:ankyrin repeat and sterile alpha motif domain-containing protein 1B isoform X1 [Tachysurus ichikawai]
MPRVVIIMVESTGASPPLILYLGQKVHETFVSPGKKRKREGSNVVEDQDLLEIGILNSAHRQRLLQAIRLLPRVRPIGYDGNNPTSVAEWLESLELGDYTKSFLINGYTSMELVKKIWDIELINIEESHVSLTGVKVLPGGSCTVVCGGGMDICDGSEFDKNADGY